MKTHPKLNRSLVGRVLAVAGLFLFPALGFAQSGGTVTGTVTDQASSGFLVAAEVRLAGTDRTVVTGRDGSFVMDNVPAGAQRLEVTYVGRKSRTVPVAVAAGRTVTANIELTESDVLVLEAFTVESVREGQARAINQQRTSNTISSIISADAIGNLPDRTVADALTRLPGVNVVVEGGEAAFASIRGTDAQHNSVTLDGDRFTTSGGSATETQTQGDNRAVDLSLIPSEMVGGIEVIKALTADRDADSFGGTVNLVTRSAYDIRRRSINGKIEYIHNQFRDKSGRTGTITYTDVLNQARTFGVSATLTYRKEDRSLNEYEISYYQPNAIPVGTSGSGTPMALPAVGVEGMDQFDTRLTDRTTEKFGGTANFDWKLSPTTELHLRTFYNRNEDESIRYRSRIRGMARWNATSTNVRASGGEARFTRLYDNRANEQDVYRLSFDGKTKLDSGRLDYGIIYGDSTLKGSMIRHTFDTPSSTERRRYDWSWDRSDPWIPRVIVTHRDTGRSAFEHNPTDNRLSAIRFHRGQDEESDLTSRLDYLFNQSIGGRSVDWKVGAKFRGKERQSRPSLIDYGAPTTGALMRTEADFTPIAEPRNLFLGTMPTAGRYYSQKEILAHFEANRAAFTTPSGEELRRLEARKYDAAEDILAGYAMGSTKFDRLEVIAGVRWEQTETSYTWVTAPGGPRSGGNRYDDLYPSVVFNYRFNKNVVVRAAWTNTLSRPSYGELVPYDSPDDTAPDVGGTAPGEFPVTYVKRFLGNDKLRAQQSENFDLSFEYYFQPTGVLSVALFRKDITDFIYRNQTVIPPATPGGTTTLIFQNRNGSRGKVNGLEISWQHALTFLPGPLAGLGLNINATFIDGSSTFIETAVAPPHARISVKQDFLPSQPERIYNAQLWWERYGFTARVAVNYTSSFVRDSGGLTGSSINPSAERWDASLSYRINERFTVYAEGKNLTEEVKAWYAGTPNRPEEWDFTGRIFTGGIRFRF